MLSECDLAHAKFCAAVLDGANLSGSNLSGVNFVVVSSMNGAQMQRVSGISREKLVALEERWGVIIDRE